MSNISIRPANNPSAFNYTNPAIRGNNQVGISPVNYSPSLNNPNINTNGQPTANGYTPTGLNPPPTTPTNRVIITPPTRSNTPYVTVDVTSNSSTSGAKSPSTVAPLSNGSFSIRGASSIGLAGSSASGAGLAGSSRGGVAGIASNDNGFGAVIAGAGFGVVAVAMSGGAGLVGLGLGALGLGGGLAKLAIDANQRKVNESAYKNPAKAFPLPDKGARFKSFIGDGSVIAGQDPNIYYDVFVAFASVPNPAPEQIYSGWTRGLKGAIYYEVAIPDANDSRWRLSIMHGGGQRYGLFGLNSEIYLLDFQVARTDGIPETRPPVEFVPSTNTSVPTGYADPIPALPNVFSPDFKPTNGANNGDSTRGIIAGAVAGAVASGAISDKAAIPTVAKNPSANTNSSPLPNGFSPSGQGLPPKSGFISVPAVQIPATQTPATRQTIGETSVINPSGGGYTIPANSVPATPVLAANQASKQNEFTAKEAIEASKSPVPATAPKPAPTPQPSPDTNLILTAIGVIGLAATAIKNRADQIYTNTTPTAQQTNAKQGVCDAMQPSQCGFEGVKQATTEATNPIKEIANDNKGLLGQVLAAIANLVTLFNALKDFIFDKIGIILKLLNNQVVDRAVNMLNLAVNITNLLMLTESAGKALGSIVDAVFAITPFQFENDKGQKTTASSVFGQNATAMVVNIIGADNYASLKENLAVGNRIIKSSTNLLNQTSKLLYQQSKQQQKTGVEVANIGNALIDNGVINQNSYPKMPNSPEANAAMTVEDSNILQGKLGIVKQGIAGLKKITQEINSKVRVVKGIQKAFKNVTDLADGESKARKAIRNTAKQEAVRKSKFKNIHVREIKKK